MSTLWRKPDESCQDGAVTLLGCVCVCGGLYTFQFHQVFAFLHLWSLHSWVKLRLSSPSVTQRQHLVPPNWAMNNWRGDIIISNKLQQHANKKQFGQQQWLRAVAVEPSYAPVGSSGVLSLASHVDLVCKSRTASRQMFRHLYAWDYTILAHRQTQLQRFDSCVMNLESFINILKRTFVVYFASRLQGYCTENKSRHLQSDVDKSEISGNLKPYNVTIL